MCSSIVASEYNSHQVGSIKHRHFIVCHTRAGHKLTLACKPRKLCTADVFGAKWYEEFEQDFILSCLVSFHFSVRQKTSQKAIRVAVLRVLVCVDFSLHIDPGAMAPVMLIYGYVSMFLYQMHLYFVTIYFSFISHIHCHAF